jgi:hypothetical protein
MNFSILASTLNFESRLGRWSTALSHLHCFPVDHLEECVALHQQRWCSAPPRQHSCVSGGICVRDYNFIRVFKVERLVCIHRCPDHLLIYFWFWLFKLVFAPGTDSAITKPQCYLIESPLGRLPLLSRKLPFLNRGGRMYLQPSPPPVQTDFHPCKRLHSNLPWNSRPL